MAPIGENTLFDDHFQIVSKLKVAQLYDLNRPSGRKKSPIKSMNWNNGNLIFDYLRYDRAAYGPVDLDNFQVILSKFCLHFNCLRLFVISI